MGLFSLIGGILGGNSAKRASQNAETAQLGYLNRALDQQQGQYNQDRADLAPYRTAGTGGLSSLQDIIGLNGPEAQARAMGLVESNPMYQRTVANGNEALLQNASATGGIRGGNTERGLADFRADALAQAINDQIGRYGSVASMGLGATGTGIQSGDNLTQLMGQTLGEQGQVRAGGILTRGGIQAGIWNNLGAIGGNVGNIIGKFF